MIKLPFVILRRSTFDKMGDAAERAENKIGSLRAQLETSEDQRRNLSAKLLQAQKNDMPRDPATGRWTKK